VALLEAHALAKSFATAGGTRDVLRDVTLSVERGEFLAIVGAMGSGKSTLMHLFAGLTEPDAGRLVIGGEVGRGVRRDAALVFQNHSLLPWFSAIENVRLAVDAAFPEWPRSRQRDQARRTLELVGLGEALHRRPGQLSGGMRQRVAIARAFAIEPQLLFLDEPFGALDALTRETLQQELERLCSSAERPVTTVMITNNVDEAVLLADRIVSLTRGPGATIGATIPVDLPRPRTAMLVAHDPHGVRVRASVVEALTSRDSHPHGRGVRGLLSGASREPAASGFGVVERLGGS
jgi:nitrate/nitrite transport system ATP-binding protein